jgi:hypothetical protein
LLKFVPYIQADEVEAVLANTKQILNQFLRKSRILSKQFLLHTRTAEFSYSMLISL